MGHEPYDQFKSVRGLSAFVAEVWHRRPRLLPQWLAGAARLILAQRARQVATYVLLVLSLLVQGALILVTCYLIDLGIALMDLWAELARKHLELTL